jgi:hypothetical protein
MRSAVLNRLLPAQGSGSKWSLWSQDSLLSDASRWSVMSYASIRGVMDARKS